jgi:hypothetical protein
LCSSSDKEFEYLPKKTIKMSSFVREIILDQKFLGTLFPRIPVIHLKKMKEKLIGVEEVIEKPKNKGFKDNYNEKQENYEKKEYLSTYDDRRPYRDERRDDRYHRDDRRNYERKDDGRRRNDDYNRKYEREDSRNEVETPKRKRSESPKKRSPEAKKPKQETIEVSEESISRFSSAPVPKSQFSNVKDAYTSKNKQKNSDFLDE